MPRDALGLSVDISRTRTGSTLTRCVRYSFLHAVVGVPLRRRPDRVLPLRPPGAVSLGAAGRALRLRYRDGQAAEPHGRRLHVPRHPPRLSRFLRGVLPGHDRAKAAGSAGGTGASSGGRRDRAGDTRTRKSRRLPEEATAGWRRKATRAPHLGLRGKTGDVLGSFRACTFHSCEERFPTR